MIDTTLSGPYLVHLRQFVIFGLIFICSADFTTINTYFEPIPYLKIVISGRRPGYSNPFTSLEFLYQVLYISSHQFEMSTCPFGHDVVQCQNFCYRLIFKQKTYLFIPIVWSPYKYIHNKTELNLIFER